LYLLKAKILESMDKRTLAIDCYIQALQKSVYLTEALDSLLQHEMLMSWEEKDLINSIMPNKQQCNETDLTMLKFLYEQKLKKYYKTSAPSTQHPERTPINSTQQFLNTLSEKIRKSEMKMSTSTTVKGLAKNFGTPTAQSVMSPANKILYDLKNTSMSSFSIQTSLTRISMLNNSRTINTSKLTCGTVKNSLDAVTNDGVLKLLDDSVDVKVANAEELFYNCEYKKCLKVINEILDRDPYHKRTLFVQIGCLMELKDTNGKC
jgi:anaphase-promoting complex subunit 6